MFRPDAIRKVDDALDAEIVHAIEQRPDLLDAIDRWVSLPDRNLIPTLTELAALINLLVPPPPELRLYRGFEVDGIQESFGLTLDALKEKGNHDFVFTSDEKAISFSTDYDIAKAYGSCVVLAKLETANANFLTLIPELMYCVAQKRKQETSKTEKEVIVMPPMSLDMSVVDVGKPIWWSW